MVLKIILIILSLASWASAATYPGSPACVRTVAQTPQSSWGYNGQTTYNGSAYQSLLTCTKDNYGGLNCVRGTGYPNYMWGYGGGLKPVVTTVYWNGTYWAIQNDTNSGFTDGYYQHDLAAIKSKLSPDYDSFSALPAGGCSNTCVAPEVLNQYGRCEAPPCNPPNYYNPLGNCVNCPSGVFDLASNCMSLCAHATLENVGSIIPNTGSGFCLVPPCTADEINSEGKCYPNCADQGKTYDKVTGLCKIECASGTVYDPILDRCTSQCPAGQRWQEANAWTTAGCVADTTPPPECKTINGITGTRNAEGKCMYKPLEPLDCAEGYEPVGLDCVQRPIDCGVGKHQEGDSCVDNPPTPEKPSAPPAPGENPPVTPETAPTIPPETPPEEKTAKLLENIDKNIKKQIESSNTDKVTLKSIADNQAKQVDNSAKGVEEAGKQTQELRQQTQIAQDQASTLAGIRTDIKDQTDQPVKEAIDAMGEKISDKLDEQKTDSAGPEPATFGGGLDTEQDFDEHSDAGAIATEKATAAKESLPAVGASPFIVGTTITQDACIVGNFRGTEWRACFDYPWAVVAYQIMKAVLITVGYIQSIMLINRGMNGG